LAWKENLVTAESCADYGLSDSDVEIIDDNFLKLFKEAQVMAEEEAEC